MSARMAVMIATAAVACMILVVRIGPRAEVREMNDDVKILQATTSTVPRPTETVEQFYSSQHPVYIRCAKLIDMPTFTEDVARQCGNIHEISQCSEPCAQAMQAQASKVAHNNHEDDDTCR